MPLLCASRTIAYRSSAPITAPEGFDGVFRMIALVLSVIAASTLCTVTRKFCASSVSRNTGVPPANSMMSLYETQ